MPYSSKTRRKPKRKHALRVIVIVLLLMAVGLFGAIFLYSRTAGPHTSFAQSTIAFFHMISQKVHQTFSAEEDPIPLNPYQAADFYEENGFIHCSASDNAAIGIDVSAHQGEIDWQAVANAGVEFAMIRVGYRGYGTGEILEDPMYYTNIEGALNAGLDVGVYFYSQAISVEEAREEAQFVLDRLGGYHITYPVVFDWEQSSEQERTANMDNDTLTKCTIAFCDTMEAYGYQPGFYFNQYFGYQRFDLQQLQDYIFWLAEYNTHQSFLYQVHLWQYTDSGSVPGISTAVDLNLCYDDFAQ